jgi:hypothetical protein
MNIELSPEARLPLNAHLDAVEKVLVDAGRTREQRRAIVDDLESQILDMLASRNANPTPADVDAVLLQVDPPAAYSEAKADIALPPNANAVRWSKAALSGFICTLATAVLVLPMIVAGVTYQSLHAARKLEITKRETIMQREWASKSPTTGATSMPAMRVDDPQVASLRFLPLLCCPSVLGLPGTILGWVGFVHVRRSKGMLRGKGLALFAGLFYPILLLALTVIGLVSALPFG